MKNLSILILLATTLIACTKKEQKQYSYWTINGKEYSTNNVEASTSRGPAAAILSHDRVRFGIVVFSSGFRTSGEIPIVKDVDHRSGVVGVGFNIDTVGYSISPNEHAKLKASKKNNKASYYLAPTWFTNYNNLDSILVEGTFNEP